MGAGEMVEERAEVLDLWRDDMCFWPHGLQEAP